MAVQPLLLGRHLAERLPRSRTKEYGVVAEACLAAPLRHDLALTLTLEELGWLTRSRQSHHAHESRGPRPGLAFESFQQLCCPLYLCRCEAGGVQPREPSERGDLYARVVPQCRELRPAARSFGLQPGVLDVGLPYLVDFRIESNQLESRVCQQLSIFAQLSGVAGSDDQPLSQARRWNASARRSAP